MSDAMNKSLDDAIKERKKTEGKGKKGGKPGAGAKRGATGPKGRLQRTRGRNDRKPATRPTGKGANRADKNRPGKAARKPISKLGVTRKFIRRTRAGGDRPPKAQASEKPVSTANKKRLRVSNLDYNISHKDLTDLFSKFGSLVKNRIDFDDLGRSKGTATIEYDKHESALKAIEEYNGATLDGKTLSVEFDGGKTTNVPKAGKKVIAKRDIRPVRRDDRRDDRRGGDRRDTRRDTRRDSGRDNRRDNGRDNGRDNRRQNDRRGGDRRGGDRRGGDRRGDRRGGNRRGGNRRGGNRKEGAKKE